MEMQSKHDLGLFRIRIISDIEQLLKDSLNSPMDGFDWLRNRAIRKIKDICSATLQNLRITGKIHHKKILGSYYYNKIDIQKLFEDEN